MYIFWCHVKDIFKSHCRPQKQRVLELSKSLKHQSNVLQWVLRIKILGSEMIIFESTLTTYEASSIFWGSYSAVAKISSSLKSNHHKHI